MGRFFRRHTPAWCIGLCPRAGSGCGPGPRSPCSKDAARPPFASMRLRGLARRSKFCPNRAGLAARAALRSNKSQAPLAGRGLGKIRELVGPAASWRRHPSARSRSGRYEQEPILALNRAFSRAAIHGTEVFFVRPARRLREFCEGAREGDSPFHLSHGPPVPALECRHALEFEVPLCEPRYPRCRERADPSFFSEPPVISKPSFSALDCHRLRHGFSRNADSVVTTHAWRRCRRRWAISNGSHRLANARPPVDGERIRACRATGAAGPYPLGPPSLTGKESHRRIGVILARESRTSCPQAFQGAGKVGWPPRESSTTLPYPDLRKSSPATSFDVLVVAAARQVRTRQSQSTAPPIPLRLPRAAGGGWGNIRLAAPAWTSKPWIARLAFADTSRSAPLERY